MGQRKVVAHRVGRSGCASERMAGVVAEGLEARCLLSAVLFVDDSAVGSGDGSGWDNAFTDLQLALSQAVYGDEIHIAAGMYRPTATTDRTISFVLKDGVSLLGGYAGYGAGAGDPDAHDIVLFQTILSGDIGAAGDNTDNSYHVIASYGVSPATLVDGITVTAGYADGSSTDSCGGAMYNISCSASLSKCTFSANAASGSGDSSGDGGAMYNISCSASLSECTFSGNTASGTGDSNGYGGGMYNQWSPLTLTNCTFSGNRASGSSIAGGYGGGMCNIGSSPTMTNCVLSGNTAGGSGDYSGYGGGMYNDYNASPVLTNCILSRNTASGGGASSGNGGGIYNNACSPTLTDCMLNGNTAGGSGRSSGYGGGIYNSGRSVPVLTNCAFSGNRAKGGILSTGKGGGIYDEADSLPWLINCTLSANSAKGSGAAVYNYSSQFLHLTNCIVWGSGDRRIYDGSNTAIITYSDIQGGYGGDGNIKTDPLFVRSPSSGADGVWGTADDDYGDLRLQVGSPCVDVGDNTAFGYADITTDLAGNPRFIGGAVDLGAYEGAVPSVGTAFGAQHSLTLTDTDNDIVRIGLSGGGAGTVFPDNTIGLTGTTAKSVLTITVKKGAGGDGLFHLSGVTSDGPLKGISASAVILSGKVQINTMNLDAGKGSVSLKFRTISDADVQVQGMSVSAITVGDRVSDSRIVTTGSIGKFRTSTLLNSDVLVGVAMDFAGQFAGHDDFSNSAAKLGALTVTGQKLPRGSSYPAYVSGVHISAPSVGTLKLANVDSTVGAVQVHVLADTGTLTVTAMNPLTSGVSVLTAGSWKPSKAGRPAIWEVV